MQNQSFSMNAIHPPTRAGFRSRLLSLATLLAVSSAPLLQAQSLISSSDFFNPDFTVAPVGGTSNVVVNVTGSSASSSLGAGDVTWTHTATGLVQTRTLGLVNIEAASYASTIGDSLVFGRSLDATVLGTDLFGVIPTLTSDVAGASAAGAWSSTATVSNLNLSQGVLYSVTFDVTVGSDVLNLGLFETANFTLLNGGTPIENVNSDLTLNLLGLLSLGGSPEPVEFQFYAPAGLGDLGFRFETETAANASLLGGLTDSDPQFIMEVSNFSIAPVPEPSSLILATLGVIAILRRRRPCGV
ncbi:PEP-CTERM sorting domain-containing protein [Prosthecobacter debontii]|nr:PEP-CTERM sorting domain-containing protein [Prosthecobacter debontii]